jgi:hypothetical protein
MRPQDRQRAEQGRPLDPGQHEGTVVLPRPGRHLAAAKIDRCIKADDELRYARSTRRRSGPLTLS